VVQDKSMKCDGGCDVVSAAMGNNERRTAAVSAPGYERRRQRTGFGRQEIQPALMKKQR